MFARIPAVAPEKEPLLPHVTHCAQVGAFAQPVPRGHRKVRGC